jgi:outer membrane scaffolding protein for murein synthesis (MipA/OmpV family)
MTRTLPDPTKALMPLTRTCCGALVALALGALAAPAARADQPLWEIGLGAGLVQLPHYRGSNESGRWLLPVPFVVYRGDILRADRNGARAVLYDGSRVDVDLSFAASAPARSKDDVARQGMSDLAPTIEIGPKVNVRLHEGGGIKVDLRVPVRKVITLESSPRDIGWSVAPVINLDLRTGGFPLGMQAGPIWGDRRLHAYFYDVPALAATATRSAYAASGGYAGWQAALGSARRIDNTWVGAFVRYDSLAGAAFEPSPLVRSRHNLAFGVAFAWIFAQSSERVAERF